MRAIWKDMMVGDSLFFSEAEYGLRHKTDAANGFGAKHGWKFAYRTLTENGVKGVRIWRIA